MPATEQTWRSLSRMHAVFAVSSALLLIVTIWMFYVDDARSWKPYQRQATDVTLRTTQWRKAQAAASEIYGKQAEYAAQLKAARRVPLQLDELSALVSKKTAGDADKANKTDKSSGPDWTSAAGNLEIACKKAGEALSALKVAQGEADAAEKVALEFEAKAAKAKSDIAAAKDRVAAQDAAKKAEEEAKKAQSKAKEVRDKVRAAQSELDRADEVVATARSRVLDRVRAAVLDARFAENKLLDQRKFANARLDAARAAWGLLIRDSNPADPKQAEQQSAQVEVNKIQAEVEGLNVKYQEANAHRKALQEALAKATADEDKARKQLDESAAEVQQLGKLYDDTRPTWFTTSYPLLGKKWLTLPILSAFNPPEKVEQIWLPEVTQDFNFKRVPRFDRCVTCHTLMQKTVPGSATEGAYQREHRIELTILSPAADQVTAAQEVAGRTKVSLLRAALGIEISPEGLLSASEAAVSLVLPGSRGAKAEITAARGQYTSERQGLQVGDVIEAVEGDRVATPADVERLLLQADHLGKSLKLSVRRGLPNPFTSHPRLDLYVGDGSPHKMASVGCTICHEGQDSATAFKWASHSPNDLLQRQAWVEQHGWFENHDWRTPMNPKRFVESGCLKCHHEVMELRPSDKYPQPPAPKLLAGYDLIRKYGCFGCHEINGNDGPKRIGPDLRLEPNFTGAGLQLSYELNAWLEKAAKSASADEATEAGKQRAPLVAAALSSLKQAAELARTVGTKPDDRTSRQRLLREMDSAKERLTKARVSSATVPGLAIPDSVLALQAALKDVEYAGTQRKVGPSLRFVASKTDPAFLADWIAQPKHFRPSTRMPQFFGNDLHLKSETGAAALASAHNLEAVEVQGLTAYLTKYSQPFEYVAPPAGAPASDKDRGRRQFETRGCLACHNLVAKGDRDLLKTPDEKAKPIGFPAAADQRPVGEIVQGPDLSELASKFGAADRNKNGRKWLYSWIREPSKYHPRTVMPDLFLEPILDKDGKIASDPAADIVEFLLSVESDWQPAAAATAAVDEKNLNALVLEHLKKAFHESEAAKVLENGIPKNRTVKGAEVELAVADDARLTSEQKLLYIGRKAISKYGCYGCHDVPGFEDAKPIGTELNNWGRKDPSRLAFEHITHYLHEGHGHAESSAAAHPTSAAKSADKDDASKDDSDRKTAGGRAHQGASEHKESAESVAGTDIGFYRQALEEGNRTGFIYQKLKEPRSYDYRVAENKKYNDWLRMPQFSFTHQEREAIITFVLGLVADPPVPKFVYKPSEQQLALQEGRKVLDKYNCASCHMFDLEKIRIAYEPGKLKLPAQADDVFPLVREHISGKLTPGEVEKLGAPEQQRGVVDATLIGLPVLNAAGEPTIMKADEDDPPDADELLKLDPRGFRHRFTLWEPVVLTTLAEGDAAKGPAARVSQVFMPASEPVVPGQFITARTPPRGGFLAQYLLPRVIEYAKADKEEVKSPAAVWGWVPPPLVGEGRKVQGAWLHDFLLDPHLIRPAAFLRMPKFNMSSDEASKLVNYFAAADAPNEPVAKNEQRSVEAIAAAEEAYRKATGGKRFDDALTMTLSKTYCIQCHRVGDLSAGGSLRAQAPNLAEVHRRMRYDYVQRWIANPKLVLPYTSMPNNIKYDPSKPNQGAQTQEIKGTSSYQLETLTDFLMHFDHYAERGKIAEAAKILQAAPAAPPAGAAPDASKPDAPKGEVSKPESARPVAPGGKPPLSEPKSPAKETDSKTSK